ncbi:DUF3626 domain-containing protein, partial [Salmonella enterica subsp. enterica]|nr:DUF3626 domain-containing protein [Salmonella enterica subsp. enterica serovar Emek]
VYLSLQENSYSKTQLYDYARKINQELNRDCIILY